MSSERAREVLFVTGSRAEYDILYPAIAAVAQTQGLSPALVVTGSHLAPVHGLTVREIEADGFPIAARIETLLAADSPGSRVKSAAIQLSGLVDVVANRRPDYLVVVGDREEAITTAMAGSYMDVPVVHIGGGDTADDFNVDNAVRHAVTKLAHLHMAASEGSAARILRLGEEPWRVHVVGAPGLDRLRSQPELSRAEVWKMIGCAPVDGPYVVVIQHSLLPEQAQAGAQMRATLEAVAALGVPAFISGPNSDAGNHAIAVVIDEFARAHPHFVAYKNLPRAGFINLLRHAGALAGNSSAGIIEAPFLKLPVVNVGSRQIGREHGGNVQFVDYEPAQIGAALRRALHDEIYRREVVAAAQPYGDGTAGARIAQVLAAHRDRRALLNKRTMF